MCTQTSMDAQEYVLEEMGHTNRDWNWSASQHTPPPSYAYDVDPHRLLFGTSLVVTSTYPSARPMLVV